MSKQLKNHVPFTIFVKLLLLNIKFSKKNSVKIKGIIKYLSLAQYLSKTKKFNKFFKEIKLVFRLFKVVS